MTSSESSIIRVAQPLDSRYGGIVGWWFQGEARSFYNHHRGVNRQEFYGWAGGITQMVVDLSYFVDLASARNNMTKVHNTALERFTGVRGIRWHAFVVRPDMSPQRLFEIQYALHAEWEPAANIVNARLAEAQATGDIDSGEVTRDTAFHALPHLHTADPVVESGGGVGVPITGLWLPKLDTHLK
jgi:hypothetical protein